MLIELYDKLFPKSAKNIHEQSEMMVKSLTFAIEQDIKREKQLDELREAKIKLFNAATKFFEGKTTE